MDDDELVEDQYIGVWASDDDQKFTQAEWEEIAGIIADALSTSRFHHIQFDVNFEEIP